MLPTLRTTALDQLIINKALHFLYNNLNNNIMLLIECENPQSSVEAFEYSKLIGRGQSLTNTQLIKLLLNEVRLSITIFDLSR